MKTQPFILLTGFILTSLFGYSQIAPQKGYYSIHKNSEKLNKKHSTISNYNKSDSQVSIRRATKGYYSINNNGNTNNTSNVVLIENNDSSVKRLLRPVITKGYYSIGNNAQKLNNH